MTWHTDTVSHERLGALLSAIRSSGGTIARCRPQVDGIQVVWTTNTTS